MSSHSKDAPGGNAQIILVTGATGNQGGAAAARLPSASPKAYQNPCSLPPAAAKTG
jgi:hypothetical protein